VYSSRAVELFWQCSELSSVGNYRIYLDDSLVSDTDGTSYYVDQLNANTNYTFTIEAINSGGVSMNTVATVRLLKNE